MFFQILIACLLGSAGIAVIAVLVGSFNDTLGKALATIAMVALHAGFGLSYISDTEKRNQKDGGRSIELFSNTVFTLIVLSFITSVFAIWEVLNGPLTLKLYLSYAVLLFATLHADVIYRIRGFEQKIDKVVLANYAVMALVVLMLFTVIFTNGATGLGEFFYRLLAAAAIVDATMTITAVIMHKMYLQRHPVAVTAGIVPAQTKNFWRHPLVILLIIFLMLQVVGSIIGLVLRGL